MLQGIRRLSNFGMTTRRVLAISDIHVDFTDNLEFVRSWSPVEYSQDALLLAGDVTDKLDLLHSVLADLKKTFAEVFFVPGNHDLWVRDNDTHADSIAKYQAILKVCDATGVHIRPAKFQLSLEDDVWIVPLLSWYATPEEDAEDSLYVSPRSGKEDEELNYQIWMDNHLCKWPHLNGVSRSKYFANQNGEALNRTYNAPVISFSHFLPRTDLIMASTEDNTAIGKERQRLGLEPLGAKKGQGALDGFNFSRYAGCKVLETQVRQLGSAVHVHGHQHRNRDRTIDGIRYVSHCLGYNRERKEGLIWGMHEWNGPKQVWPPPDPPGN